MLSESITQIPDNSDLLAKYLDDRPDQGVFKVDPAMFVDRDIFELEVKGIFEKTWNFLTLESQIANKHDFVTSKIGRTPILLTRDASGQIRAYINQCRHKGAILCSQEEGNQRVHVCPYHHWSYDSTGKHFGMKDRSDALYPAIFADEDTNLIPIRVESYNGLIFGSLSTNVPSLADFLGEVRLFIDLIMDQGAKGMEFIPGRAPYKFQANWKMQQDNGLDPYHVTSTHISLLNVQKRSRDHLNGGTPTVRSRDWDKHHAVRHHSFNFHHGHAVYFTEPSEPEKRPVYKLLDELRLRKGDARAANMLYGVQIHIFPNLQLASEMACIFRKFQPVAVDETEMDVRCLGAIGEGREQRSLRLRQFEDFFNASGMASPDDSVIYENCQRGFTGRGAQWLNGYSRGLGGLQRGPNPEAERLGISPVESLSAAARTAAEINLHSPYREWRRLMSATLAGRSAYA
jgi:benzoate/toluate 1,2-dioxygenase alpha subunit